MPPRLFCFGYSYSAAFLARRLGPRGFRIAGTARAAARVAELRAAGIEAYQFDGTAALPAGALDGTTHMLASIPPDAAGDPALRRHGADLARLPDLAWIGYLSTTGVYGDSGGAWVDETTPVAPLTERAGRRVAAEAAWQALTPRAHIFRLAGIYGPGRSALDQVRAGTARRVVKPGQAFSRIHVADIAQALEASIARPDPGAIYNLCDDEPAASADVVTFACELLGHAPPPEVPFEAAQLSDMARSFYGESRRVGNAKVKRELGLSLLYPTYREGLRALAGAG
ncbi:SDR family oxidoreductase [Desertibaculum subflavum]|uniref:SDR family oxidoreductase n=1 Tax=Desertibaculum subflavum TaxID=2268458 RepID=UPI000E673DDF